MQRVLSNIFQRILPPKPSPYVDPAAAAFSGAVASIPSFQPLVGAGDPGMLKEREAGLRAVPGPFTTKSYVAGACPGQSAVFGAPAQHAVDIVRCSMEGVRTVSGRTPSNPPSSAS